MSKRRIRRLAQEQIDEFLANVSHRRRGLWDLSSRLRNSEYYGFQLELPKYALWSPGDGTGNMLIALDSDFDPEFIATIDRITSSAAHIEDDFLRAQAISKQVEGLFKNSRVDNRYSRRVLNRRRKQEGAISLVGDSMKCAVGQCTDSAIINQMAFQNAGIESKLQVGAIARSHNGRVVPFESGSPFGRHAWNEGFFSNSGKTEGFIFDSAEMLSGSPLLRKVGSNVIRPRHKLPNGLELKYLPGSRPASSTTFPSTGANTVIPLTRSETRFLVEALKRLR